MKEELRRNIVCDLYIEGYSYREIAERFGVSVTTIHRDIKKIREEWKKSRPDRYQEGLDRALASLDRIEANAWKGWNKSLEDAVESVEELNETKDGSFAKKQTRRRGQSGDSNFLAILERCQGRRAAIQGFEAPKQMEVATTLKSVEIEVKTHEDVITLNDLLGKEAKS